MLTVAGLLVAAAVQAALPLAPDPAAIGRVIRFDGFVDERGQPFTAAPADARPWIVSPIYTRCPTTCSAITAGLKAAVEQSGLRPAEYRVLSFSFDPEETDASLAAFRARMQLPPDWITLRAGDPAALESTLRRLDFRTVRLDGGVLEHPNVIAILAPDRRLVAYLPGVALPAAELTGAVARARAAPGALDAWRLDLLGVAALGFLASSAGFVVLLARRRTSTSP